MALNIYIKTNKTNFFLFLLASFFGTLRYALDSYSRLIQGFGKTNQMICTRLSIQSLPRSNVTILHYPRGHWSSILVFEAKTSDTNIISHFVFLIYVPTPRISQSKVTLEALFGYFSGYYTKYPNSITLLNSFYLFIEMKLQSINLIILK